MLYYYYRRGKRVSEAGAEGWNEKQVLLKNMKNELEREIAFGRE